METKPAGSEEPINLWHHLTGDEALAALETDKGKGLSASDVAKRSQQLGLNELKEAQPKPI